MQTWRGLRFEAVSFLAREPKLWRVYRLIVKRKQRLKEKAGEDARDVLVGPDTELVIDGFQGSANTFFTAAFTYSQSRPVVLAHHLHAPTQIIRAVQWGIPAIVTIREPRGATLSLTSRWPYISLPQALRSYIGFYERIRPYADGYVLSTFDQTIHHMDEVIRATNQRFGTHFDPFVPTAENLEAVRPMTPQKQARRQHRRAIRAQKAHAFETAKVRALLAKAETLYEAFIKETGTR